MSERSVELEFIEFKSLGLPKITVNLLVGWYGIEEFQFRAESEFTTYLLEKNETASFKMSESQFLKLKKGGSSQPKVLEGKTNNIYR